MRRVYEPIAQLKHSITALLKKWPLMILILVVDVIFFTVFGFVYTLYFQKIIGHLNIIMQQAPSITTSLQEQDIYAAAPIAQSLSLEIDEIKKLALLLAVSTLVIWVAFQALNWWLSFRVSGRKISYVKYLKSFSVMSAIWVAIASLIIYLSINTFFSNAFTLPGTQPNDLILSIGLIAAFAVVGYFALVSYSVTGKIREVLKKTVMFAFLKSEVFVAYIILLILAVIINFIMLGLSTINFMLSLIVGAVLVLLLLLYARVYMINVIQKIDKRKN